MMNLISSTPRPRRANSSGRKQYQVATSSDFPHLRCHKGRHPVKTNQQRQTIRPPQKEDSVKKIIGLRMEKRCPVAGSNEGISGISVSHSSKWPPPPPLIAAPVCNSDEPRKNVPLLSNKVPIHVYICPKSNKNSMIESAPTDMALLGDSIHEDSASDISDMSYDDDFIDITSDKKQRKVFRQGGVKTEGPALKLKSSSTELLPCLPLSKFHRTSIRVSHDSNWGITTIQFDDKVAWESRDDKIWPSDEEDTDEKRQVHHHTQKTPSLQQEIRDDDCERNSKFICQWPRYDHVQSLSEEGNSSPRSIPTQDISSPHDVSDHRSTPKSYTTVKTVSTTTGTPATQGANNLCRFQRQNIQRKTCSCDDFLLSPTYTTTSTTEASSFEMDVSFG
jgi:hypothetical protein